MCDPVARLRHRSRRGLVVFWSLILCLSCASQTRGSAVNLRLDDQLGILEVVVQGVMNEEDWADWIVKVDPRPINVSHGPVFLGSAHYLSTDSAVISARASVVRGLGATTTSAYPRRRGCTGSLVSPPNRDSSGCPSEKEIVLVLAAEAEVVEGEWTLRMFASF